MLTSALFLGLSAFAGAAFNSAASAQTLLLAQAGVPTPAPVAAASAAKSVLPAKTIVAAAITKPEWRELTALQKQALQPLSQSWATISEAQKLKWLEVSKNYPGLSPAEQTTMHSRMNEWVAMSPQQRAAARLNFAKTKELSKELSPVEKKAKWESYQALSPEEKLKLAATASPRPTGAATAVKPVEPQKLAVLPKKSVASQAGAGTAVNPVSPLKPSSQPAPSKPAVAPAAQPQSPSPN